jgi:hypothetical protein
LWKATILERGLYESQEYDGFNAVEMTDFESENLETRISRQASLEASLTGGQGSTLGCRVLEKEEGPLCLSLSLYVVSTRIYSIRHTR